MNFHVVGVVVADLIAADAGKHRSGFVFGQRSAAEIIVLLRVPYLLEGAGIDVPSQLGPRLYPRQ